MPIQINLLADSLAEEDLRRRDPVRRAIYAGVLAVALFLVWYSSIWLKHIIASSSLAQIQATIQQHNLDYAGVVGELKKIADENARLNALQKLSTARFLDGNLLNAMEKLYVPNVQMTQMHIEQSYRRGAGSNAAVTEHIVLTLDARDASANPGDGVNQFKALLGTQDFFKTNLDTNNGVNLVTLSPPQTVADGKPFVVFTLECHFPDKTR
jgi:cell division protein FtsB